MLKTLNSSQFLGEEGEQKTSTGERSQLLSLKIKICKTNQSNQSPICIRFEATRPIKKRLASQNGIVIVVLFLRGSLEVS